MDCRAGYHWGSVTGHPHKNQNLHNIYPIQGYMIILTCISVAAALTALVEHGLDLADGGIWLNLQVMTVN